MAYFESRVELNCSPSDAFDFLTNTKNIAEISPPAIGLTFTNAPESLALDEHVEFQVIHFGQVQSIAHLITKFEPHQMFEEVMTKGPLSKWIYTHRFEANDNGVIVIDEIDFDPPGGILGLIISEQKLLDQLEEGFDHRYQCLEKTWS